MAQTKKTDADAPERPRAAAPRRRTPPSKATPVPDAPRTDVVSVGATQPLDVAADMSAPGAPEAIATTTAAPAAPSHDEIAEAAYHRYLQRGGGHGMDFEDWVEAERILRTRR